MIATEGSWSLGTLIGGPVTAVFLLIGLGSVAYGLRAWLRHRDGLILLLALAFVVVVAGVAALMFYPYQGEYHQWREVSGVVAEVDSRLLPSQEAVEEKFVVRFEGSQQEFGVLDTRAALVEKGDEIVITCKREWQFAGTDGYDCRWVESLGSGG